LLLSCESKSLRQSTVNKNGEVAGTVIAYLSLDRLASDLEPAPLLLGQISSYSVVVRSPSAPSRSCSAQFALSTINCLVQDLDALVETTRVQQRALRPQLEPHGYLLREIVQSGLLGQAKKGFGCASAHAVRRPRVTAQFLATIVAGYRKHRVAFRHVNPATPA
jgi:hypothetical protein